MWSIVTDFILIVVKLEQHSENSQRFQFNSREVMQPSKHSQIFPFHSSEAKRA